MKITAFIPARGGSKGLPGKNIKPLNGVPLIAYAIRAAKNCKHVDEVVVSTDSQEIFDIAVKYGARGVMREAYLATDEKTSETAIENWLHHEKEKPDVIVFMQCTSPLVLSQDIDRCLKSVLINGASYIAAEDKGIYRPINEEAKPVTRKPRQQRHGVQREAGSVYVVRTDLFQKHGSRFGETSYRTLIPANRNYEIDTLQDFRICEFILQNAEELGVEVEHGSFE